jgi:hypothetical protein
MAVVSPPSVAALPTPPSTASPSTFDSRADAFLTALPTFQTENNAVAANVFANATDAAASATSAATQAGNAATSAAGAISSAQAAAASAGATLWVSGTTYSIGDVRYSPATQRVYRRLTAGAGTTDPSADGTNWKAVDTEPVVVNVTGTSQTAFAFTHYILINVAATTVTLPASPAIGDVVRVTWKNNRADNVVARNGQLIGDVATDAPLDTNIRGTAEFRFVDNSWEVM